MQRSIVILLTISMVSMAFAQGLPHEIHGSLYRDLPTPEKKVSVPSQRDNAAIEELSLYAKATGADGWKGMVATGTFTLDTDTSSSSATLSILPENRARLEVNTVEGISTTVVNRSHGHTIFGGGHSSPMTSSTAEAGIVPFDLPFRVLKHAEKYGAVERGLIVVDKVQYHRLSIPLIVGTKTSSAGRQEAVLDCYFDPNTHLLQMTAVEIELPGHPDLQVLRVIHYSSYATEGELTIPHEFSETINGQPIWSLKVKSVDVNNLPLASQF